MDPCFLTASEAADRIQAGRLTSETLVRSCLERIEARDGDVKAWLHVEPRAAIARAREADKRPPANRIHGIPIGVKDIIDTCDMPTTHNSAAWQGHRPSKDAACVAIPRALGAIILGKTDTVEFATAGRMAATRHPLKPDHTPGGSSSGSAAAVGDFQAPLSLGTQTGGSLIRPASFNGIYALKPTWNAVSREGVKHYSISLDTVGWYGRSVRDLELVSEVFRIFDDGHEARIEKAALKVALCRSPFWSNIEAAGEKALLTAADRLTRDGVKVVDMDLPARFGDLFEAQETICFGEGRAALLDDYLLQKNDFHPDFRGRVENARNITPSQMVRAYALADSCRAEFDQMFEDFDVILTPASTGDAPKGLHATGSWIFNAMWTLLHAPCLAVPCTMSDQGLPVGVQLVGPRFSDARLLRIAEAIAPSIDEASA